MALSNYLEAALLNHVFRSVTYTPPTTVYLALFTAGPNEDGTGTEVSGGSYARQAVTFSAAVSPDGRITNNVAATFTNMPVADIVGTGTYDAASGGNLLTYSALGGTRSTASGENLTVSIGDLNIYMD